MISCDKGMVQISGDLPSIMAEFGMLSSKIIEASPEKIRVTVSDMLTEMLEKAKRIAMERRCDDAWNESTYGEDAGDAEGRGSGESCYGGCYGGCE